MGNRVGIGRDIHELFDGEPLVLGGVVIHSARGFRTHSDGDVLCHALIDALAGAMTDGDLGTHFPEDDPGSEDARSLNFVEEFASYVAKQGFKITNIDSFVTLGTVKLRPYIAEMQSNIAAALSIDPTYVSVKARSNDGIGPEGVGDAASATVIVLLEEVLF